MPVTTGADATEYIRLLFTCIWPRNQTYTVASAPAVTGSVFMERFSTNFGTVCVCAVYGQVCVVVQGYN